MFFCLRSDSSCPQSNSFFLFSSEIGEVRFALENTQDIPILDTVNCISENLEFINLLLRFKGEFSKSQVFQFNILNWSWMEFEFIITEISFYKRRPILHMEFKRLCHYSIYIISLIQKFISIIYWSAFCENSIFYGRWFWVYRELCFKWH